MPTELQALAQGLLALLQEPDRMPRVGLASCRLVKGLALERRAMELRQLYARLVSPVAACR